MRKFITFLVALALLLGIGLAVLLFSPVVHRALFLWALQDKVETVSVEKVKFTLSSFQLEQFEMADQGMYVSADSALVKASWVDMVRTRKIDVDEIVVRGLNADLATMASASGGGLGAWLDLLGIEESGEPWQGVLAKMKPSAHVSINRVRMDGRILLSDQQRMDMNLSLDDLTLGETAKILVQGGFLDEGGASPVNRATYELGFELDQSSIGKMNAVAGTVALQMAGAALNPGGQIDLTGNWKISRTPVGEVLTVYISESGKPDPLLDIELDMNVESGQVGGRLAANLDGALLPASLLGLPPMIRTATFSTDGQVGWNYHTGVGQFDVRGAGVLEQRPWQYLLSGNGTVDGLPAVKGFVKTGFADEAGPGNLTVNLDVNGNGEGKVHIPVLVERGDRVSKLVVNTDIDSLKLDPFQVALVGETVFLADLQSVGTAMAAWGYSMQKLDTATAGLPGGELSNADNPGVPWEGISGDATVTIQQLVLPQGHTFEDLTATAAVGSESILVKSLHARIDRGSIQGRGSLVYDASGESTFTLRGEGLVKDIPSDLLDLGSGAPITGLWNGSVSALAQTQHLEQLGDAIQLSMDVEGSAGILQLTRINEDANQKAQLLNFGLALFGGQEGRLGAVSRMTQYLQRVPYDSIRIKVARFPTGQVSVGEFTIQGPELLLTGSGNVNAQSWATLAEGALDMKLVMGTKGNFGENAKVLGLTGVNQTGGYQLWKQPINISGTVNNPNYSSLKDLIFGALR